MSTVPSLAEDFARDGYAVLEGAVPPETCARLRERAWALAESCAAEAPLSIFTTDVDHQRVDDWFLDSGDQIRAFFEEEALLGGRLDRPPARAVNKVGHALHAQDPVLGPFLRDPRWRDLLVALGQARPRAVQSMLIYKPPQVGGEVRWHQDETYLAVDPGPVIGLWWALEDADAENGALQVLPGGQREALRLRFRRERRRTWHESLDERPLPLEGARTLEVPVGALVLFHGRLPHASAPNRSARSRVALTLHCVDEEHRWLPDNWMPAPARAGWGPPMG